MVSLRLNQDEERRLEQLCQQQHKSKSEVLKSALQHYYESLEASRNPYELGKDLFDQAGSEETDLSTTYKQRLKDRLRDKHTH